MGLLLDFHYSDYWADPQQQNKPLAWVSLSDAALRDTVAELHACGADRLKRQGTLPDMVQIGNEVNHGILLADGQHRAISTSSPASCARAWLGRRTLTRDAGDDAHRARRPKRGGAVSGWHNMLARGLTFDMIGLSYYPRWHGTLEDLYANVRDLAGRYTSRSTSSSFRLQSARYTRSSSACLRFGQGRGDLGATRPTERAVRRERECHGAHAGYDSLHAELSRVRRTASEAAAVGERV